MVACCVDAAAMMPVLGFVNHIMLFVSGYDVFYICTEACGLRQAAHLFYSSTLDVPYAMLSTLDQSTVYQYTNTVADIQHMIGLYQFPSPLVH